MVVIEKLHGAGEAVGQMGVGRFELNCQSEVVGSLLQRLPQLCVCDGARADQREDEEQGACGTGQVQGKVSQAGKGDGQNSGAAEPAGTADKGDPLDSSAEGGQSGGEVDHVAP